MEYNGKEWKEKKEGVYVCGEEYLCISIEYVNRTKKIYRFDFFWKCCYFCL